MFIPFIAFGLDLLTPQSKVLSLRPKKLEKKVDKENRDKFGQVKPVDGSEFVRDSQELKSRDGHVRLRKTLKG